MATSVLIFSSGGHHRKEGLIDMKSVVDYTILITGGDNIENFESEVKEKLLEGWQPLGAPFEGGKNRSYLMQALVKYTK
jgi:hypothetical protein